MVLLTDGAQGEIMAKTPQLVSDAGRPFPCFPAAVVVIVVNEAAEVLLFSSKPGEYEAIAGGVEVDESLLEAALRELHEEAGADLQVEPVGVVHAYMFPFDQHIRQMISICFVFRYLGGSVVAADDMTGASHAWFSAEDFRGLHLRVPEQGHWILERAVALAASTRGQTVSLEYEQSAPG